MSFLNRRRQQANDRAAASGSTASNEPAIELVHGEDLFPGHVFDALNVDPVVFGEPIGGSVRVVEKRLANGLVTLMTSGASRLPTDSGERVELAVEVIDGQQGAGRVALAIVCDDIATNRRVPPLGTPWRNPQPFLNGTRISAIMATHSRWGAEFDEVRTAGGQLSGHVRTLRLLTDAEATFAAQNGWELLVEAAGSIDALLDVSREDTVLGRTVAGDTPVIVTKLHAEYPPRWVTFTGTMLESVTGRESDAYMDDSANHEIWSTNEFVARFPQVARFTRDAQTGQTALFTDNSGSYTVEEN